MPEKYHSGAEGVTWDDTMAHIGEDFGGPAIRAADPVDSGSIRRFCEVLELGCPLHSDEAIAQQHGYKGLVAPLTSTWYPLAQAPSWSPGQVSRFPTTDPDTFSRRVGREPYLDIPMPPTVALTIVGIDTEYYEPVVVGDHLTTQGRKLLSVTPKTTTAGPGAFVLTEQSLLNQRGSLVSKLRWTAFHYDPFPRTSSGTAHTAQPASNHDEHPYMQVDGLVPTQSVDWDKQRTFDDVAEGDEMPKVPINLTFQRLIEWAAVTNLSQPPHSNPRYALHYGAPDIYANNVTVQTWWERAAREFIGLDGHIKRLGPFRIRTFAIPGDQVVTSGTVRRKWREGDAGFLEIEMVSEHRRAGVCVGPGPVVVTLPLRR